VKQYKRYHEKDEQREATWVFKVLIIPDLYMKQKEIWLREQRNSSVYQRFPPLFSAGTSTVMIEVFRGFLQPSRKMLK
jgi:hypothetical protein